MHPQLPKKILKSKAVRWQRKDLWKANRNNLLLAAKTTSQKTQRKKWSLFSSKSSGKQGFEREKGNNASVAQSPTDAAIQGLRHSPVTVSNGAFVTVEGEGSLSPSQPANNDTSRTVNSINSQEKLGISELNSARDAYQKPKNPDFSLELTSVEHGELKQTNELKKNEEAKLGHDDSTEQVSAGCRLSDLPTREAAETLITSKSKSSFAIKCSLKDQVSPPFNFED